MIELEFAELHGPIFVAGTNLAAKLDPKKRTGLKIQYERKYQELYVTWNGKTAIVPKQNVACMIEAEVIKGKVEKQNAVEEQVAAAMPIATKITAQYDTPMSHVFAGPGGGKLRD